MLRWPRSVVVVALVAVGLLAITPAAAQDPPPPPPTEPPTPTDGAVIGPGVLETAQAEGVVRVVAELAPGPVDELQAEADDAVPASEGDVVREFESLPYTVLELTPEGIEDLAASGTVQAIGLDAVAHPELNDSVPLVNAPPTWSPAGFDGTGQVVSIIDTGVDGTHPALDVVGEACFADDDGVANGGAGACPNGQNTQMTPGAGAACTFAAFCLHGTHVAGIAASHDATYRGIAPDAGILAIQVYGATGPGGSLNAWFSDIAAALEYTLDQDIAQGGPHEVAAVNMSLSDALLYPGDCTSFPGDPARNAVVAAMEELTDNGIAVVAAAGNQNFSGGIAFPACNPNALAAGNSTKPPEAGNNLSNVGPQVDLWAPGTSIWSTVPGGFGLATGTSMAAPHIAGAFALLHEDDPVASVDLLTRRMKVNGPCIKGRDTTRRFHRLDVEESRVEDIPLHTYVDVVPCAWEELAASWADLFAIVTGFPDGSFQSSSSLNRAQAVAWLWKLLDEPAWNDPHPFTDVGPGAWYREALNWAAENMVVVGFGDGTYRPKDPVTRGQIVQWLWIALGSPTGLPSHPFSDGQAWNEQALNWAAHHGIVTGFSDGTFRPNEPVTRAQITVQLHRLAGIMAAWSAWTGPYPDPVLF